MEFAAELHDFLVTEGVKNYPSIRGEARISLFQSADHILNTYDEKISKYAEQRFLLQDINVILGAKVKEVKEKSIVYSDKVNRELVEIGSGLVVWNTGIDTVPIVHQIIKTLPEQRNKRFLLTDSRLRLLGTETKGNIYAIGDCSTTFIPHLGEKADSLFELMDTNGDGVISLSELHVLAKQAKEEVPIMATHFNRVEKLYRKYLNDENREGLTKEEFQRLLIDVDKQLKSYPATAQCAAQQGDYLAKRFIQMAKAYTRMETNEKRELIKDGVAPVLPPVHRVDHHKDLSLLLLNGFDNRPFAYRHFGSLAYLGSEIAAIDLGEGKGAFAGWSVFWLWKSVYWSKQVSMRTRLALAVDWFKSYVFGRDTSEY